MKRVGFVIALTLLSASSALADFQAGLTAYNNKDFKTAVSTWTEDATRGDLNSQYNLGILFEKGVDGYPKDLAAAYGWYRLAASQNVKPATEALARLKPLMTPGQIEEGNKLAVEMLGKWYRQNIGRDEQEYQKAKVALLKERKAKIEAERQAAAARAERQRNLNAQRDADAKLAGKLQAESRQAAIKAAQDKAEEAKRRAFIEKRRKEEAARLAALKEEKEKQEKIDFARQRLAELQAKQKNSGQTIPAAPVVSAPAVKAAPAPEQKMISEQKTTAVSPAPVVVAAPKTENSVPKVAAPEKAVVAKSVEPVKISPEKKVEPVVPVEPAATVAEKPKAAPAPEPVSKAPVAAPKTIAAPAVQKSEPKPSVAEVKTIEAEQVVKPVAEPAKPAAPAEKVAAAPKKPFIAKAAPSTSSVVAKAPAKPKMTVPVMTNGLDVAVVNQIVQTANSLELDTPEAIQDIKSGRTDIQALQWSLISAARGKGEAKRMSKLLEEKMTPIQIAEANRRAADWINKRQARQ